MWIAYAVLAGAGLAAVYTYVGYPWLVRMLALLRPRPRGEAEPAIGGGEWPLISFSVPAYNEEAEIAGVIESLLAIDYPADRRQIIIVSDASTDRTDEIVRSYADRGVELVRQPQRMGKTAAEELAAAQVRGDIVVNTDASIRIAPNAIRPLVARFRDPRVGVASGRDVSISHAAQEQSAGEAGYVGYEMVVRDAETRLYGIVGASGSLYAIRTELHRWPLRADLSRDFAAALHAEEQGFRAVSVPEAVCYVPRTDSLQREYRRKVRTIERGMHTLWYKRHLLNPLRHPEFAWMLWSHKLARWGLPWAGVAAFVALVYLAFVHAWAAVLAALGAGALFLGALGWALAAKGRSIPRPLSVLAYGLMGNVAAMRALFRLVSGQRSRRFGSLPAAGPERSDRLERPLLPRDPDPDHERDETGRHPRAVRRGDQPARSVRGVGEQGPPAPRSHPPAPLSTVDGKAEAPGARSAQCGPDRVTGTGGGEGAGPAEGRLFQPQFLGVAPDPEDDIGAIRAQQKDLLLTLVVDAEHRGEASRGRSGIEADPDRLAAQDRPASGSAVAQATGRGGLVADRRLQDAASVHAQRGSEVGGPLPVVRGLLWGREEEPGRGAGHGEG